MSDDLFPAMPVSAPDRLTTARKRCTEARAAYDKPHGNGMPIPDEIRWELRDAERELWRAEAEAVRATQR